MIWKLAMTDTIDICNLCFPKRHPILRGRGCHPRKGQIAMGIKNPQLQLMLVCKLMHQEIAPLATDYTFEFCHQIHLDRIFDELLASQEITREWIFKLMPRIRTRVDMGYGRIGQRMFNLGRAQRMRSASGNVYYFYPCKSLRGFFNMRTTLLAKLDVVCREDVMMRADEIPVEFLLMGVSRRASVGRLTDIDGNGRRDEQRTVLRVLGRNLDLLRSSIDPGYSSIYVHKMIWQ